VRSRPILLTAPTYRKYVSNHFYKVEQRFGARPIKFGRNQH